MPRLQAKRDRKRNNGQRRYSSAYTRLARTTGTLCSRANTPATLPCSELLIDHRIAVTCGSNPTLRSAARGLAGDGVMNLEDLGFAGELDPDLGEDRHQPLAERIELFG